MVRGKDEYRVNGAAPAAPRDRRPAYSWHLAAALLFLLAFISLATLFSGAAYDDAYITFRYARNLADGYGFCYNPGVPSLGTTTPLFTLVLAGLTSLGVDIPVAGSLLTCFSLLLLAALLYLTFNADGRPLSGIAAGLLVLVNFRLVLTIGGEPVLLCLLVFAAAYLSEVKDRPILAALLLACAFLTRGEGILAAPVLLGLYLHRHRRFPWTAALAFFSVIGAWFLYSWLTVGALAPSTMSAKMAQGRSGLFHEFWPMFWIWAGRTVRLNWLWILLLLPAASGLWRIVRNQGGLVGRVLRAYLLWVTLYLLGYTILGVAGYHWYSVPVIIAILALGAMGLPFNEDPDPAGGREGRISRYSGKGAASVALALLIVFLCLEARTVLRNRGMPTLSTTLYPLIAERLNDLAGPEESVAYLEIGVLGYMFHGRTLDLLGLSGEIGHGQIARGNLIWGLMKMQPDWYIDVAPFSFMTGYVVDEPWFPEAYSLVETVVHPVHQHRKAGLYRRKADVPMPWPLALEIVQQRTGQSVSTISDDQGGSNSVPSVGQSFYCDRDWLQRIDILPVSDDGLPMPDGALFRLREGGPEGRELIRVRIPAKRHFGSRRFFPIRLKRPLPSGQRQLYFSIEPFGMGPQDAIPLTFKASEKDVYGGGTLHVNGHPVEGDLAFRTWYQDRGAMENHFPGTS